MIKQSLSEVSFGFTHEESRDNLSALLLVNAKIDSSQLCLRSGTKPQEQREHTPCRKYSGHPSQEGNYVRNDENYQ